MLSHPLALDAAQRALSVLSGAAAEPSASEHAGHAGKDAEVVAAAAGFYETVLGGGARTGLGEAAGAIGLDERTHAQAKPLWQQRFFSQALGGALLICVFPADAHSSFPAA
jgi:hypothetical protein